MASGEDPALKEKVPPKRDDWSCAQLGLMRGYASRAEILIQVQSFVNARHMR